MMGDLSGWAAILSGVAAMGGMAWQGVKTRAEVRAMRLEHQDVATELRPNHGSTMRDAVGRIEVSVSKALELAAANQADVAELRLDMGGMRAELRGDREYTRQVRLDVTQLRGETGTLHQALMTHIVGCAQAGDAPKRTLGQASL